MQNETLDEIKHPSVRAKLEGVQEVVYTLDVEMERVRNMLPEKRAMVSACKGIADRLEKEYLVINGWLDEDRFGAPEAKLRIEQAQIMVGIVRDIQEINSEELQKLEGRLTGLDTAAKISEQKFNETALKYQRHQRMEEEEREAKEALRPKKKKKISKKKKVRSKKRK